MERLFERIGHGKDEGVGVHSKLTDKQWEVLQFLKLFIERRGIPPTRHELADAFEWKSVNAADQHLRLIEKKGYIRLLKGKVSRGIVVTALGLNVD